MLPARSREAAERRRRADTVLVRANTVYCTRTDRICGINYNLHSSDSTVRHTN